MAQVWLKIYAIDLSQNPLETPDNCHVEKVHWMGIEGMSLREIGKRIGVSRTTVVSNLDELR